MAGFPDQIFFEWCISLKKDATTDNSRMMVLNSVYSQCEFGAIF